MPLLSPVSPESARRNAGLSIVIGGIGLAVFFVANFMTHVCSLNLVFTMVAFVAASCAAEGMRGRALTRGLIGLGLAAVLFFSGLTAGMACKIRNQFVQVNTRLTSSD